MLQFNLPSIRVWLAATVSCMPLQRSLQRCCAAFNDLNIPPFASRVVHYVMLRKYNVQTCALTADSYFLIVAANQLSFGLVARWGAGSIETHKAAITLSQIRLGERAGQVWIHKIHSNDTLKPIQQIAQSYLSHSNYYIWPVHTSPDTLSSSFIKAVAVILDNVRGNQAPILELKKSDELQICRS